MAETTTRPAGGVAGVPGPALSWWERWGQWVARRARIVLFVWLVALPLLVWGAGHFASSLATARLVVEGSQSQRAESMQAARFPAVAPETDLAVVHSARLTVDDPAVATAVGTLLTRLRAVAGVVSVTDPRASGAAQVSPDRHTVLVPVAVSGNAAARQDLAGPLQRAADSAAVPGVTIEVTGDSPLAAAAIARSNEDVARADAVALPVAGVVLLIAFGSLLAAGLSLTVGGLAVLTSFGVLGALSAFAHFDVFTRTVVMMLSIALGIDYALFMITRFREELAAGPADDREAVIRAVGVSVARAGHAVAFSAVAVMVSLCGLFLVRTPGMHGMAFGAIAAVASMLALALTLLPAVLALLGRRVNAFALPWAKRTLARPDPEHSVWGRIADFSLRRPVAVAGVALAALVALAWPLTTLRYGVADQIGPIADTTAGRGYALVAQHFPAGTTTPIQVIVARTGGALTDTDRAQVSDLSREAHSDPEVAAVTTGPSGLINAAGDAALVSVVPRHGLHSSGTSALVERLRLRAADASGPGRSVLVGGAPAKVVDSAAENTRATPRLIAAVLGLAAVILLLAFRSLLLPIKAVLMNLCTVGASFGAMVLVFQEGHGAGMLHLQHDGFIQIFVPLITFTFVFGLSMDYEVFMLSRMKEAWDETGDNTAAVRAGIAHTARVITAAAAIMVAVFGAFMLARSTDVQQMGFMLALAVLIDASVVRLFLVPALMRLMGRWNWWLPARSASRRPAPARVGAQIPAEMQGEAG